MRKAELEDVDWRVVAQDRGQWRRVVHRAYEMARLHRERHERGGVGGRGLEDGGPGWRTADEGRPPGGRDVKPPLPLNSGNQGREREREREYYLRCFTDMALHSSGGCYTRPRADCSSMEGHA